MVDPRGFGDGTFGSGYFGGFDLHTEPEPVVDIFDASGPGQRFPFPPWDPTRTVAGLTVTPYRDGGVRYIGQT